MAFLLLVASTLFLAVVPLRPAEAAGSASISGSVTDRAGRPVAGVTVEVTTLGGGDPTLWSTDDTGRFVADGLVPGRYAVCFYPGGEDLAKECWEDIEPSTPRVTPVEVGEGQQVTGIDAELAAVSRLRGTVTDQQGDPVAGIWVGARWYAPDEPDSYHCCESSVTAADGSFQIGPLYSGEYLLLFSDNEFDRYATEWWDDAATDVEASRIRVARGESVDGLDAQLDELAHVSGRVHGAGGASARGAVVRVFRAVGSGVGAEVGSSPLAADGSYDVGGLRSGTYRIAFDAAPGRFRSEYWNDVRRVDLARDVVISGTSSVTGLDAVLSLAPPVRVTRLPALTGRARVGERLRVTDGAWDVLSLRFTYQWRADGVVIPGITDRGLRLTPRLRGKHISVRVKATATAHERSPGLAITRRTQPVAPRPH